MSGLALNEDQSHFFFTRSGKPLTESLVDAFVDQYANTQVSHLLFNPNTMRTSYASKVWTTSWDGYDPDGPDSQPLFASLPEKDRNDPRRWIHTAWALNQAGIDVYRRWIARARQHGITPWLTMRMNDVHNVQDEQSYIHSEFWKQHPEYWRVPYHFTDWIDKAFDYGREEVRDYHFKLIEELAERYNFDGLELDWMRFGYHFRPGFETEGARLLTAFVEKTRRLLDGWEKQRGHRIRLGARVPSRPQTSRDLGMDAGEWAQRGLIDWLVVTPFWASTEPDMPVEIWRQLLRGTGVELMAGMEILLRPYPKFKTYPLNSLESIRGAALALLQRGADRIYLFNHMDSQTTIVNNIEDYSQLIHEIGDPQAMVTHPRRHVITFSDTWALGEPRGYTLPAEIAADGWYTFRVPIGPKPEQGEVFVNLAFESVDQLPGDALTVMINGETCGKAIPTCLSAPCPPEPTWKYPVMLAALHDGYNIIEVHASQPLTITWVEISIDPNAN